MAPQDYVKRNRAPQKKTVKKNKPMPETSAKFSFKQKISIAIALIVVVSFGYGLWYLNQQPTAEPQPPVTDTKQSSANPVEIPKPPKEKWSYMKDLKNKQVEEGHYEVEEKGPYQMQCGSFRTLNQAEALKAKIAFVGIESQVRKTTGKNGTWYKVVLGPYSRKRAAEADKHKLKSNNINYCQIWLWQ
jgi:cell division protein FtsN